MALKRKRITNSEGAIQRAKHADGVESQKDEQAPTLLTLPAELRNRIYELALLRPGLISITSSLKAPGLLATCRQIREEASKIYYLQNKFEMDIRDCDGTLGNAYLQLLSRYASHDTQAHLNFSFMGKRNWTNLMVWCKDLYERPGSLCIPLQDGQCPLVAVVAAAHSITLSHTNSSWQDCLEALKALRHAVGTLDKAWMKD